MGAQDDEAEREMVFEGDMDDVEYKTSEMVTADKKDTVITKVARPAPAPALCACVAAPPGCPTALLPRCPATIPRTRTS